MARPAHIAPLDEALPVQVALAIAKDEEIAAFYDEHLDIIEKLDTLQTERADAFHAVRAIEEAIRKLGYVVLGVARDSSHLDDRSYSPYNDKDLARKRRDKPSPEEDLDV